MILHALYSQSFDSLLKRKNFNHRYTQRSVFATEARKFIDDHTTSSSFATRMYEKSDFIALKGIIFALQMRTSKILVTNEDYLRL